VNSGIVLFIVYSAFAASVQGGVWRRYGAGTTLLTLAGVCALFAVVSAAVWLTAEALAALDDWGGFRTYNHYSWAWAWAGNTPLRLWKRYAWLGGTRTPLVVHWPRRVSDGGAVRDQFVHVIDLMPTVLETVGLAAPATDAASMAGKTERISGSGAPPPLAPAPASGPSFQVFVMPVGASATGTPALSETGPSGQSVTSQSSLGAQDLVVQAPASCTWAVKVTGS